MISTAVFEVYINRLTNRGEKFFSLLLCDAFSCEQELADELRVHHPIQEVFFYFKFDSLKDCWCGYAEGMNPMNAIEFISYYQACDTLQACRYIRSLFVYSSVGKLKDWPLAISLARHKVRTVNEVMANILKDIPAETLAKMREVQKQSWEAEVKRKEELNKRQYQTTPADALLFYFLPGKKGDGLFWRASDVVKFMQSQHPGFWKLSEEETGRLLTSEGFAISKGREKGVRGYFLKYREGFKPGVYMDLKEAG